MNRNTRVVAVAALTLSLCAIALALFGGWFDSGKFEIKEATWSASGQVALVVERSDQKAMNSDDYFVLVDDHVLSPGELKRAYHSDRVVFAAASDCLTVRWRDLHNLTIGCRDGTVDDGHINAQRLRAKDVSIAYENIPVSKRAQS